MTFRFAPSGRVVAAAIAMLIALAGAASAADSVPIVAVTGGQVRGALLDKGGAVFKGIPFAAPPVGDLRWRETMPVKPWTGVREATAYGPTCPQILGFPVPPGTEINEDCLQLDIWTPEWPSKARKPVMVWIHGGGNFGRSPNPAANDGESLSRHGVVLVSINYRVAALGFFSHPKLTAESPHHASGNQGILDQIAALKWVRDNIGKFGGDPGNVTIFGESAGALDVSVLMTSPLSKGLFQRVIAESGPVTLEGDPLTLAQAEKRGEESAARWGKPASASLKDLRAVSSAEIMKAEPDYLRIAPPNLGITIDGYVFRKRPAEVFASGEEDNVGLIIGSNGREQDPGRLRPTDLRKTLEQDFGPLAPRAVALYEQAQADPVYGTPVEQWSTDTSFRCGAVAQLAWHTAAGNPSFEYSFDRVAPGRESVGATHGAEVWYVFDTLALGESFGPPNVKYNATDQQVSDAMEQYWTNFAKTGDPNRGASADDRKLPPWPKFDATSRAYIEFTEGGPVAREGLRRPFCDLFIENVKRQMK
jgi:para-nitrobenzyl esterase